MIHRIRPLNLIGLATLCCCVGTNPAIAKDVSPPKIDFELSSPYPVTELQGTVVLKVEAEDDQTPSPIIEVSIRTIARPGLPQYSFDPTRSRVFAMDPTPDPIINSHGFDRDPTPDPIINWFAIETIFHWDTRMVEDGLYEIRIRARDKAGNTTYSKPLILGVDNVLHLLETVDQGSFEAHGAPYWRRILVHPGKLRLQLEAEAQSGKNTMMALCKQPKLETCGNPSSGELVKVFTETESIWVAVFDKGDAGTGEFQVHGRVTLSFFDHIWPHLPGDSAAVLLITARYPGSSRALNYTDLTYWYEYFTDNLRYPSESIHILTDSGLPTEIPGSAHTGEPTAEDLRRELEWLREMAPEVDHAVVVICGHGNQDWTSEQLPETYFVTTDAEGRFEHAELATALAGIATETQLFSALNTCHSGGLVEHLEAGPALTQAFAITASGTDGVTWGQCNDEGLCITSIFTSKFFAKVHGLSGPVGATTVAMEDVFFEMARDWEECPGLSCPDFADNTPHNYDGDRTAPFYP